MFERRIPEWLRHAPTPSVRGFATLAGTEAMARGDRVELRGFGAFSVKARDARVGRNPRSGASVNVARKFVPFFKAGKDLRERLNDRG